MEGVSAALREIGGNGDVIWTIALRIKNWTMTSKAGEMHRCTHCRPLHEFAACPHDVTIADSCVGRVRGCYCVGGNPKSCGRLGQGVINRGMLHLPP